VNYVRVERRRLITDELGPAYAVHDAACAHSVTLDRDDLPFQVADDDAATGCDQVEISGWRSRMGHGWQWAGRFVRSLRGASGPEINADSPRHSRARARDSRIRRSHEIVAA
jgi:hypothetical protein